MGSKVRLDSDGRIGYVCKWKHDNDSGVTAIYVQFTDGTEGWFASTELTELE